VAMLALKAVYHVIAIRRLGYRVAPPATRIVSAYATSQVIRYLPGKVLGVVYEMTQLAGQVPAHHVVAANIVQTLHTNALTVLVLTTVLVWVVSGRTALAIVMLTVSVALIWLAHRQHITERSLAWAASRIPRLRTMPPLPTPSGHASLPASLLLLAEWVPYFLFWILLLPAGSLQLKDAVMLGSCYAGASLVANFAVLVPSGLVVREALFLWVGSHLAIEPASLIVLGMLSRLLFTLADAVLVPLAWGVDRFFAWGRDEQPA